MTCYQFISNAFQFIFGLLILQSATGLRTHIEYYHFTVYSTDYNKLIFML